jgi:nucleotide-binding universal stress UspA family protein
MFEKILIANDGSAGAIRALRVAVDLAKKYGAELHSISVEEKLPHYAATVGEVEEVKREADRYFKKVNDEAAEIALKEGVELHTHVRAGHGVETIVGLAKEGAFDLLIIGFVGHSRLFETVWGSTSRSITRHAPCTVVVVK